MNRRSALVSSLVLVLLGALAVPALAPAAKMKLRAGKQTVRTVIPDSDASAYFDYSQSFSTTCRGRERALAPGIIDSSRHIASQSFGPSAVGGFTVGLKGQVATKLQILCARGVGISHRRKPVKISGGSSTSVTASGRSSCGKRGIAIGAPLSQEFSPGRGRFVSRPTPNGGWEVVVENIPSTFPFGSAEPAYVDHACVSKRFLRRVKIETGTTKALASAAQARVNVTCKGPRRAIGWGVDLRPVSNSIYSGAGRDGWSLPFLRRAMIAGKRVQFIFERPPGARVTASDVTQTGYVICGTPR